MARYSINIFDRDNPEAATVLEHALNSSLRLSWFGSEDKIKGIIGSELAFDMEVTGFQDAYFAHLNSFDERKYKVTLKNEQTGEDLWAGHLIPDLYEEPYQNGAFFVGIVASCGLSTLKNNFLPNEFYAEEKLLSQVVAECLKLTGLELDFYVSPALTNTLATGWHELYLDTYRFVDDQNDKKDAYTILEEILESTLCSLFQDQGSWYIYGHNKKTLFEPEYFGYNYQGDLLGTSKTAKQVKAPVFYDVPRISTVAPRKTVRAFYPIELPQIPESAYNVENDGFVLGSDIELINYDWAYSSLSFVARYDTEDGKVFLGPNIDAANLREVVLRKELLFEAGSRVEWVMEMTNAVTPGNDPAVRTIEEIVEDGDWKKILHYDIFYTDPISGSEVLLYSNKNGPDADDLRYQLEFGENRKAELRIKMIAPATAYYNIRFYQPVAPQGLKVDKIYIDELQANILTDQESETWENTIKEPYSLLEEVELHFHDDMRYLENFIRLAPIEPQVGELYDTQTRNGIDALSLADGDYLRLSYENLRLCLDHEDNVFVNGSRIQILGFIYNYLQATDEFLLQYDSDAYGSVISPGATLQVELRKYAPIPAQIARWLQWTDDVYRTSYGRYGKTVTDIMRALYTTAHPLLKASCRGFVSMRDLLSFSYAGDKVWYMLSVVWELDRGRTDFVASQNFYGQAVTTNLPPSVEAGPDLELPVSDSSITLTATASDPDGSIVSVLWELIDPASGSVVIQDADQLTTLVDGLELDAYTFRVTVTDDAGLTAIDTVSVYRAVELVIRVADYFRPELFDSIYEQRDYHWFNLDIPGLMEGQVARYTVSAIMVRETPEFIAGANPTVLFTVSQNITDSGQAATATNAAYYEAGSYEVIFLQEPGESHLIKLNAKAFNSAKDGIYPDWADRVYAKVQVDITAEIIDGQAGVITNIPLQFIVEARK